MDQSRSFRRVSIGSNINFSQWSGKLIRPGSLEQERTDNGGLTGTWEVRTFPCQTPQGVGLILRSSLVYEQTAIRKIVHEHGIAERRKRSDARRTSGSQSVLIVPTKSANSTLEESREGSETSEFRTAIGKHTKCLEI